MINVAKLLYNALNLLHDAEKQQPISHPWGWDMQGLFCDCTQPMRDITLQRLSLAGRIHKMIPGYGLSSLSSITVTSHRCQCVSIHWPFKGLFKSLFIYIAKLGLDELGTVTEAIILATYTFQWLYRYCIRIYCILCFMNITLIVDLCAYLLLLLSL